MFEDDFTTGMYFWMGELAYNTYITKYSEVIKFITVIYYTII